MKNNRLVSGLVATFFLTTGCGSMHLPGSPNEIRSGSRTDGPYKINYKWAKKSNGSVTESWFCAVNTNGTKTKDDDQIYGVAGINPDSAEHVLETHDFQHDGFPDPNRLQ